MTAGRPLDPTEVLGHGGTAGPWTPGLLERLLLTNGLGLTLVLVGWSQSARAAELGTALTWLNVSLVGVGIAGTGNALWLLRGRRAVSAANRLVLTSASGRIARRQPPARRGQCVASPGTIRYHRPDCQLVRGRETDVATASYFDRLGRIACEACQP